MAATPGLNIHESIGEARAPRSAACRLGSAAVVRRLLLLHLRQIRDLPRQRHWPKSGVHAAAGHLGCSHFAASSIKLCGCAARIARRTSVSKIGSLYAFFDSGSRARERRARRGSRGLLRVTGLPAQRALRRLRPVRHRRRGAEHDRRLPAHAVRVAIEHHGDVGERPVEGIHLALLADAPSALPGADAAAATAARISPGLQIVLALDVLLRQQKKLLERDDALAPLGVHQLDAGAECATSAVAAVEGCTMAQPL